MNRKIIKSNSDYDELEFDIKKVKEAQAKIRRKMPTSVSLPPHIVDELKAIAEEKGIPYQVLMRSLIMEGLVNLKRAN
jgi:predicted DNA binding CopG/RHH family protein